MRVLAPSIWASLTPFSQTPMNYKVRNPSNPRVFFVCVTFRTLGKRLFVRKDKVSEAEIIGQKRISARVSISSFILKDYLFILKNFVSERRGSHPVDFKVGDLHTFGTEGGYRKK